MFWEHIITSLDRDWETVDGVLFFEERDRGGKYF